MKNASALFALCLFFVVFATPAFASNALDSGSGVSVPLGAGGDTRLVMSATSDITHINGQMQLGDTSTLCSETNQGAVRFHGGVFQGCNGNGWVNLVTTATTAVTCPDGQVLKGFNAAGETVCSSGKVTNFTATSNGSGTAFNMGSHSFCALARSYVSWHEQAGGCTIELLSNVYLLEAHGDASVYSGQGISCEAFCFDF